MMTLQVLSYFAFVPAIVKGFEGFFCSFFYSSAQELYPSGSRWSFFVKKSLKKVNTIHSFLLLSEENKKSDSFTSYASSKQQYIYTRVCV